MKKNYLKIALVSAFAIAAGYNVYNSQEEVKLSEMALDNVEAIAQGEYNPMCPNGCVSNGNGCACNGIYVATWREYSW